MKKIFLLSIAVTFFYLNSNAQISKGSILLGGDLSGSSQNQETVDGTVYKNNGVSFSPLIGFATKQNLVQGVFLQIGFAGNENNKDDYKSNTYNYGLGYFIRKYSDIKNNFYGFIQGNAGFSQYKTTTENTIGESEYEQRSVGLDLSPGLSFKVSKKLHLETGLRNLVGLNYQVANNKSASQTGSDILESKQFSFYSSLNNFTSGLYFGFRLLLDKK